MIHAQPRPWRRALVWLLFLGPFFFASYGIATWATGLRADVGVVVFEWERHIPFLPWSIAPYWLIDLLYAISLFLCATQAQLDTHARRLLTAQVAAVTGFLLFPLRFSFQRPPVDGFFGGLFELLGQFDKPFNQMPSLHIALMALLWVVYLRALPKTWHWLVHGTFALIGISVLTTWQHHFIDVPTGLWLGGFCLWLWPDDRPSPLAGVLRVRRVASGGAAPVFHATPGRPTSGEEAKVKAGFSAARAEGWEAAAVTTRPLRHRLALYYALAALACALAAIALGGGALWLFWPAAALVLVAAAYLSIGPAAFQKRADGSLTPAALGLLAPYVLGAWLNSRAWTRGQAAADEIVPGLLLGRLPGAVDLDRQGIAAIVDLSAELPCPTGGRPYFNVPMLDLIPPQPEQMEQAVDAIRAALAAADGPVLACCALGYSRSALAVAAWLLASGKANTPEAAEALIRRARPAIVLGPAKRAALQAWRARQVRPITEP